MGKLRVAVYGKPSIEKDELVSRLNTDNEAYQYLNSTLKSRFTSILDNKLPPLVSSPYQLFVEELSTSDPLYNKPASSDSINEVYREVSFNKPLVIIFYGDSDPNLISDYKTKFKDEAVKVVQVEHLSEVNKQQIESHFETIENHLKQTFV